MKKVTLLAFLAATTVFTSCNKDDDHTPQDQLVGTWTLYQEDYEADKLYQVTGCDANNTLTFNTDGTYKYVDYDSVSQDSTECEINEEDSETGKWSISDSDLMIIAPYDDYTGKSTYKIEDKKLTIISKYESKTFTVVYIKK